MSKTRKVTFTSEAKYRFTATIEVPEDADEMQTLQAYWDFVCSAEDDDYEEIDVWYHEIDEIKEASSEQQTTFSN